MSEALRRPILITGVAGEAGTALTCGTMNSSHDELILRDRRGRTVPLCKRGALRFWEKNDRKEKESV